REWAQHGVWIQVTAGALCNRFGTKADYWAQRLVGDGLTHILASDAHDHRRRRPSLAAARQVAERLVGQTEANNLVVSRPQGILENQNPEALQAPAGLLGSVKSMTGRGQSNEQNQSGDFAAVA
ncbi:MAG: CpsB/CapC family capsule biosynthesis tyrosine phosphatase, partial [Pseudomonadota bacterium]